MKIEKLVKKISNVYISKIQSYNIKHLVDYLNMQLKTTVYIEDHLNILNDPDKDIAIAHLTSDFIIGISICKNTAIDNYTIGLYAIDTRLDFDKKKKIKEPKYFYRFHMSKHMKRLKDIDDMPFWTKEEEKKEAVNNFIAHFLKKGIELNKEENIVFQGIKNEILVNSKINRYNKSINELTKNNNWSKMALDIIEGISPDRCYGMIEVDTGEKDNSYEEILLYLHLDYAGFDKDTANVVFEASSIFADAGLSQSDFFNTNEVKVLSNDLSNIVNECRVIPSMFEIAMETTSFKWGSDFKKYYSYNEFSYAVDRQLILLEENQDKIFKYIYKILKILELRIILNS